MSLGENSESCFRGFGVSRVSEGSGLLNGWGRSPCCLCKQIHSLANVITLRHHAASAFSVASKIAVVSQKGCSSEAQRSTSRERNGHRVACSNLAASFCFPACPDQMNQMQLAVRIDCVLAFVLPASQEVCGQLHRCEEEHLPERLPKALENYFATERGSLQTLACRESADLSTTPLAPGRLEDLDRLRRS